MPAYTVQLKAPVLVSVTIEADNERDVIHAACCAFEDWARGLRVTDFTVRQVDDVRV